MVGTAGRLRTPSRVFMRAVRGFSPLDETRAGAENTSSVGPPRSSAATGSLGGSPFGVAQVGVTLRLIGWHGQDLAAASRPNDAERTTRGLSHEARTCSAAALLQLRPARWRQLFASGLGPMRRGQALPCLRGREARRVLLQRRRRLPQHDQHHQHNDGALRLLVGSESRRPLPAQHRANRVLRRQGPGDLRPARQRRADLAASHLPEQLRGLRLDGRLQVNALRRSRALPTRSLRSTELPTLQGVPALGVLRSPLRERLVGALLRMQPGRPGRAAPSCSSRRGRGRRARAAAAVSELRCTVPPSGLERLVAVVRLPPGAEPARAVQWHLS